VYSYVNVYVSKFNKCNVYKHDLLAGYYYYIFYIMFKRQKTTNEKGKLN